jgi:hypothetical protein
VQPGVDAGLAAALRGETGHVLVSGVSLADRWAHLTVLNRHHPLLGIS